MRVACSIGLLSCLAVLLATCGPATGDESGGATEPMFDPNAPLSCAPEAEPACGDCFLMLAALDRPNAGFDIWLTYDGENTVEFEPPEGDASAVAVTAYGVGVAVHQPFSSSELEAFVFADGAWSEPQPLGLVGGSSVLAADGRCVHVVHRGEDKLGHAVFDGTAWHVLDDVPVPEGGLGDLAARDGELLRVFHDNAGVIHSVSRTTQWQAPQVLGAGDPDAQTASSIAALRVGAEFIVVHGGRYTTRVDGVWAPFAAIPSVGPTHHATVTALRDGRAAVVWHQVDGLDAHHISHSMYDPVTATWTPPTELIGGLVDGFHSVAAGAAGEELFLGYTSGAIGGESSYVMRFAGGLSERLLYTLFSHQPQLASTP